MTRVVHCKKEPFDVYIGRPGPWGNPHAITADCDRAEAIARHAYDMDARLAYDPDFADELRKLTGKTLGCWCSPLACHGDTLARLADWID